MPPAPVGQPPAELVVVGVVVPQAASRPDMLESESAAPPDRRRKSRRVVARRRSFGCMKLSLLNRLAGQARVERSNELGPTRPTSQQVAAIESLVSPHQ